MDTKTQAGVNLGQSPYAVDFRDGSLTGEQVVNSTKYLKQLEGVFQDKEAFLSMDGEALIYQVQALMPVAEGTEGGLFFGNTIIQPGKVGDEYFMTKGHFHANMDRSEYYWGIKGEGMLLFMDEQRKAWAKRMEPGSLHYIPNRVAHRTINIGSEPLVFGACWPSDAGHNYQEIMDNGFSMRLKEIGGQATLVSSEI